MGQVEELMKELKFTSNSFLREARKCEKRVKLEKLNIKKAIKKGNTDAARIHDKKVIRKGKEKINYLRLSTKLDAVVARSDAQVNMIKISKSLGSIVKLLRSTGDSKRKPKTKNEFEKQLVNIMKVQAELMKSSSSTPEGEVNSSMQQAALVGLPQPAGHALAMKNNVKVDEDDLIRRFDMLKALW